MFMRGGIFAFVKPFHNGRPMRKLQKNWLEIYPISQKTFRINVREGAAQIA
jgi:hypothetical protein